MRTDKELIDGLEELFASNDEDIIEFSDGQVFSIPSQWQKGKTIRKLINIVLDFKEGKRDWKKENWSNLQ